METNENKGTGRENVIELYFLVGGAVENSKAVFFNFSKFSTFQTRNLKGRVYRDRT